MKMKIALMNDNDNFLLTYSVLFNCLHKKCHAHKVVVKHNEVETCAKNVINLLAFRASKVVLLFYLI